MGIKREHVAYQMYVSILLVCLIWINAPTVHAESVDDWLQDENEENNNEKVEEQQVQPIENTDPSFGWSLVKLVFILALMVGLLYIGVRFFSRRNRQMKDLNVLENLGGIPVGQQKSVQLIRVGNAYYLLGVGENVELLKEIDDESIIQELETLGETPEETNIFATFQRSQQDKKQKNSSHSFKQLFTKELNNLMNNRKEMIDQQRKREDNE
ncbi:MAG TPA: flagellar biosynthetic protein FliO [Bacillota bacterium]|nr:flagellar biosynthetic protein FliO [Bacillota bacterium]